MISWKKLGMFAGGVLFGTAGIAILGSEDAKKVYTHCTAAVLRGKDCVVKRAEIIRENCGDIAADAEDINEKRAEAAREREIADARATLEAYTEVDTKESTEEESKE